jgi:hypothetical protein
MCDPAAVSGFHGIGLARLLQGAESCSWNVSSLGRQAKQHEATPKRKNSHGSRY